MRVSHIAAADGAGIPKAASSFSELKEWVRSSPTAQRLLKQNGFLLLYKEINYEVTDPNSKPVPFQNKCEHILLSKAKYSYGHTSFEDTDAALTI